MLEHDLIDYLKTFGCILRTSIMELNRKVLLFFFARLLLMGAWYLIELI